MSNQTQVPCGQYAISINMSTRGWKEISYVGSLLIESATALKMIPIRGGQGYRSVLKTVRVDDLLAHEFTQQGGDGRTIVILQPIVPNAPGYDITFLDAKRMDHPRRIVMNDMLLPVLDWLRTTAK